jgi:exodeoxyribonuclease V alpha subunit
MAEQLSGTIERVIFHNPDNGWAVLRVHARGFRETITMIGTLPTVNAGEHVEAVGAWVQDPQHGQQFKAEEIRCVAPSTVEGIEKYLGSGLVKGIGPAYARKIVGVFGERTLSVIDESPSFLKEIKGIGPKRIQQIRESWSEQKAIRGVMIFLQSHGVGTARAARIYKIYGDKAVEIVRANPYRLASDIWGFGFQTADELARRLGIDPQSLERARAAVRHVLRTRSLEGHVTYPEIGVVEDAIHLTEIAPEKIRLAVETELAEGDLVRESCQGESWLYLKPLHLAEINVAKGLRELQQARHPLPGLNADIALAAVEARMGLELAPTQRHAVREAAREKVLVITGGPGTGKTTLIRAVLETFTAAGARIALAAPTGRAAKRLAEATGREANTLHRLLEFDPGGGFRRCRALPLTADLIVVDEVSMVDVVLLDHLINALPAQACLVLVGDVDQLPSVGPGAILADLIGSKVFPVVRLTEVFRQAEKSWIVRAAHAVKLGRIPEAAPPGGAGDFYLVEADTPEAVSQRIEMMIRDRIPMRFGMDPLRDVQVLTPMNRGELGAKALNLRLQALLNPHGHGPRVERFGWTFHVGDKVMQTQNNYRNEVFNGDIGRVADIDEMERELVVDYESRRVPYDFGELDELTLAYCLTIHKSQGGEYPAVVIPLHTQHYVMLQRNLLYTALTRGRRLVVLVGNRMALERAVGNQDGRQRCSLLQQRLRGAGLA